MKKTMLFVAIATMFMLSSCGAFKKSPQQTYYPQYGPQQTQQTAAQAQNQSGLGVEIAKSPAQIYAEDPNATTLRAYASYNALPSVNGEALAAAQARAELATSIAALVKTAVKTYAEQYSKEKLSGDQVEQIMDANTKANQSLEVIAQELVRYAPVKVSNEYAQPNRTVTTHVCVELHPDNILKAVKENQNYVDAVNANQKMEIDFRSAEFDESMKQGFEDLKQAKANETH